MLPGQDGISICREVRSQFDGRIFMLTASDDSFDQVVGLEIGADDFVKNPVDPRILLARISALLRRDLSIGTNQTAEDKPHSAEVLTFDKMQINLSAREVWLDGKELDLSVPEYDLLLILAQQAGKIITRDQLFHDLRKID